VILGRGSWRRSRRDREGRASGPTLAAVPGEFEVICEIEPATRPDLVRVRQQIGVLSAIASRFLIPDNHIGRATVSSIAVAHEVTLMGGRAVACLNARDRNVLGFRRDLLTAAAYGVDEFLFVYGDRPETGRRSDDLTVRTMLEQARTFDEGLRLGVSTRLSTLPTWKREADFLFVQVSFSLDDLLAWRHETAFDGPVYAGVLVVPSLGAARKLTAQVPQLAVPETVVEALESDPAAGVRIACDLVRAIHATGAFDGVHLIPINRARETVRQLEEPPLLQ
jgi:methylenetetrahydrofolate reductase (NADPH)